MLLIDPADLTVYSLPDSAITNKDGPLRARHLISFKAFEEAANKSYSNLILAAAQGSRPVLRPESIVFVRVEKGDGGTAYAWASRVCVNHTYDYPVVHDWTLGEDFLLLWPYPMAIHSWLGFKERARDPAAHVGGAGRMVVDHPPSLCAAKQLADVAHEGVVEFRSLTLGQRYFVASLRPNLPRFALRQPEDDWCTRLSEAEARAMQPRFDPRHRAPATAASEAWRVQPTSPPAAQASARLRPPPERGGAPLDLPDELVGRILSMRLAEDLGAIEEAVATVEALSGVSRQFCECIRDTATRMLARVHPLCMQLHGKAPVPPAWIQIMLWASGLTLSSAFTLDLCKWPVYVRTRRKLRKYERPGWCTRDDGARRHALLFE